MPFLITEYVTWSCKITLFLLKSEKIKFINFYNYANFKIKIKIVNFLIKIKPYFMATLKPQFIYINTFYK